MVECGKSVCGDVGSARKWGSRREERTIEVRFVSLYRVVLVCARPWALVW